MLKRKEIAVYKDFSIEPINDFFTPISNLGINNQTSLILGSNISLF